MMQLNYFKSCVFFKQAHHVSLAWPVRVVVEHTARRHRKSTGTTELGGLCTGAWAGALRLFYGAGWPLCLG